MSSQQGDLQPNAVNPTSPLSLGPHEPLPCMRGAESRRPTNNDRRTRLDELWGRGNWVPPFPHSQNHEPVTAQTLFPYDLVRLYSISTRAAGNGVALPSLYQPGGVLHLFTSNRDGELTWTKDSARLALGRARKLWKGGVPRVEFVTHPRVAHSEPTSEQSSPISSSDIIDLLSDDEETPLVEASDDGNEDADLHDSSDSEGSRDAPIDHQQDASNVNHTPIIPPSPIRQLAASNMFFDIPSARAQQKNGNSLSDEDVKDLIRYLTQFSV